MQVLARIMNSNKEIKSSVTVKSTISSHSGTLSDATRPPPRLVKLPKAPYFERKPENRDDNDRAGFAFSGLHEEDKLKVVVVGCGFAGLATAIACSRQNFSVTLLERSSGLSQHGDSITIGCNAARICYRWGIGEEMWEKSAKGGFWMFKDAQGRPLRDEDLRDHPTKYGAPLLNGHRAQFLGCLGTEARFNMANIRTDCEVTQYLDDPDHPAVITRGGEVITADVIIVADGINSMSRQLLVPRSMNNLKERARSEYSIYRGNIKSDPVREDRKVSHLLDGNVRTWIGANTHVMLTPTDNGKQLAFYITHKGATSQASLNWRDKKQSKDVLRTIEGWDPVLVRAISYYPTALNWFLPNEEPAETWISAGGKIAFVGDAVHPMTPTSFQGGSQGIEDGATVALALALAGRSNVPLALQVYQELRISRVMSVQSEGVRQRTEWHSYAESRESSALDLLCTQFFSHDAEIHTLANFERMAQSFDPDFDLDQDVFDAVLARTQLEEQLPKPLAAASLKRARRPSK